LEAVIIPGSNYEEEARKLAEMLGQDLASVKRKVFPDGEMYVRILDSEKLSGKIAVVANTMFPNQNDSLLETLLLVNAAVKAGASKIIVYTPYLAYARQDKIFQPGEPVSADVVAAALKTMGANCLITIDVHNPDILARNFTCYENVLVFSELYKALENSVENPIVIAPDTGALNRAKHLAGSKNLTYYYLAKYRDRETGEVVVKPKEVDVRRRDVIIVDDIISTGGTIAEAARMLINEGARRVFVCASHGLMVGSAMEKLRDAGVEKVVLANTLGLKHSNPLIEYVDVTPTLAKIIAKYIE